MHALVGSSSLELWFRRRTGVSRSSGSRPPVIGLLFTSTAEDNSLLASWHNLPVATFALLRAVENFLDLAHYLFKCVDITVTGYCESLIGQAKSPRPPAMSLCIVLPRHQLPTQGVGVHVVRPQLCDVGRCKARCAAALACRVIRQAWRPDLQRAQMRHTVVGNCIEFQMSTTCA